MDMASKAQLRVNDLVRVIRANNTLGPTLYIVSKIGDRGHCSIREAANHRARDQEFDTSLLKRVERTGRKQQSDYEKKLHAEFFGRK